MQDQNSKVEVVIHLNDTLGEVRRNDLTTALEEQSGVYTAEFCPLRYHLMLIDYDSEQISSLDVLKLVNKEQVTAQLVGPV